MVSESGRDRRLLPLAALRGLAVGGLGLWLGESWLGGPWACGALLLVAILWWRLTGPQRLEGRGLEGTSRWVFVALILAALSAGASWWLPLLPPTSPEVLKDRLGKAYNSAWDILQQQAEDAEKALPMPSAVPRPELFLALSRQAETVPEGLDLILFDTTGDAIAWAGKGLLHEPQSVRQAGLSYRSSLTAVTLLASRAVEDGDKRYVLMAGRSFAHGGWPFGDLGFEEGVDWWLGAPGNFDQGAPSLAGAGEILEIQSPGAPSLYLAGNSVRSSMPVLALALGRLAWGLWALALLLVALTSLGKTLTLPRRDVDLADEAAGSKGGWLDRILLLALATWGLGHALALGSTLALLLAAACGLVALAAALYWRSVDLEEFGVTGHFWFGGFAFVATLGGVWLCRRKFEVPDLAANLGGGGETWAWRLLLGLLSLGCLCLAASPVVRSLRGRWAWLATLLLLSAAALHDRPWLSGLLLCLGTLVATAWAAGCRRRRHANVLGPLLLWAALLGSTSWEIVHRLDLKERLATEYLHQISPPKDDELNDLLIELDAFFSAQEPRITRAAGPAGDLQDLAFVLWRSSPLAARDGLTSLVVEPTLGSTSSFSFGLALDAELKVILDPARWQVPPVAAWQRSMVWGETVLGGATPWGTVRYSALPRPGFRLGVSEVDELEAYLVQGSEGRRLVDGLPRPAMFALYDASGLALASPWREYPPLPAAALDSSVKQGRMRTPSGASWFFKEEGDEGIRVLFLPVLGPVDGLERVATLAFGSLLALSLLGGLLLLLMWPSGTFRQMIERTLSSYARRLILVYTVLLLLPLIALNLVLVGSFQARLIDEQRVDAEEAISSAREFLIDYLQGLDPGFGIDTQIDRTLMEWISQVVQHQVNLYWGSQVYASSQQELFTAGLLPRRIPGDIFSRLAYFGYEIGERRQQTGGKTGESTGYLELYAPLDVPGLGLSDQGLFLSVPLLEQDREVDRELASFRRQALLVSSGLFLLLLAVGSRLAQSFTKPIVTLIEGTRRIAEGATSLPWRPREEELSSLAVAIDTMAGSLAEGRRRLLREKELVERIVENTTSGVVSVDRERRVLLQNRVAADLLGSSVGEKLQASLDASPHLQPISDLLRRSGEEEQQATLRIRRADGEAQDWTLMWLPLPGDDPAALLVVDDVTEVLRGQRLEAWAEMARIIAHEIKNPLTPIRLSTEHMQQVFLHDREQFDQVFERCTDNILRQVEELRDIASDFSIYSRIPKAELVVGDLAAAVDELLHGYQDTSRTLGVEIEATVRPRPLMALFDSKLLGRALRNLLENALRAHVGEDKVRLHVEGTQSDGTQSDGTQSDGTQGDGTQGGVRIRISDRGPGVEPENLERIFEPYFSTHESGTGLGLAITRRIIEEHGGQIEARNRPSGGLEVRIQLPPRDV